MDITQMREDIFKRFGKDSFEGKYIQYCFSHHDSDFFKTAYRYLVSPNYKTPSLKNN